MTERLLRKTSEIGTQVTSMSDEASRARQRVAQALEEAATTVRHEVEDGVATARRAAKRGQYAAEDLLEETAHCVKRNPISAVAVSFWAGFGLGALALWMASRNDRF